MAIATCTVEGTSPQSNRIRGSPSLGSELLHAVVEHAVDGILIIDARGAVQLVNPAVERLLGRNVGVLMPEPYRREHDRYLRRYLVLL